MSCHITLHHIGIRFVAICYLFKNALLALLSQRFDPYAVSYLFLLPFQWKIVIEQKVLKCIHGVCMKGNAFLMEKLQ